MTRAPSVVFALIVALAVAAAGVLALGGRQPADRAAEFHRLVASPPRLPDGDPSGLQESPIPGFEMTR